MLFEYELLFKIYVVVFYFTFAKTLKHEFSLPL